MWHILNDCMYRFKRSMTETPQHWQIAVLLDLVTIRTAYVICDLSLPMARLHKLAACRAPRVSSSITS